MKAWLGRAACAAIVVFAAARADAQITTVMDAPKRVDAKQQAIAKREEVAQDSIARVTMTGMKEWVDSAANALAVRPDTTATPAADTASRRFDLLALISGAPSGEPTASSWPCPLQET